MPWKECNQMDERLKFIARLLDGEKMAAVCRDFNVSRKTGYKILKRYNDVGLEGLTDRSRRPYRHANQLPVQIEALIVRCKQDKPHWGAPKIRERMARLYPDVHAPAISTVHAVLDRHGLVKRRTRRRNKATGTPLSCLPTAATAIPLTITDFANRYLIACEALHYQGGLRLHHIRERLQGVRPATRHPHRQWRSLCQSKFLLQDSFFNLSRLSVWWLRRVRTDVVAHERQPCDKYVFGCGSSLTFSNQWRRPYVISTT